MNEFLDRLRQRKLVQWALAYVAFAFALLQGLDIVAQHFGWPEQAIRLAIVALAIGFFVALVLAWYHGERGAQHVSGTELLILALLLMFGGGLLWRVAQSARETTAAAPAAGAAQPATTSANAIVPAKSIAVLPFVNMSGEARNDYFSDGITEEILNALAQIADLKVAARTSAFAFKGKGEDLRKVGEALGVANVLEGSVQSSGDDVRITAQLIDAHNGYHLWSEKYDRKAANIFAVEDEISKAIADHLQVTLDNSQPLVTQQTTDPRAHDLYLRALALMSQRGPALRDAQVYLEQAVAIDPEFVKAWAALSWDYEMQPTYQLVDWDTARQAVERAAQRVRALAPDSAEAHAVSAMLLRDDLKLAESDAEYRKAIALSPGEAETHDKYAQLLGGMSAHERAIEQGRIAESLNPLGMHPHYLVGYLLENARRYDEAIVELKRALELSPDFADAHFDLAQVYIQTRDFKAAEEHLRRGAILAGEDPELAGTLVRAVADPTLRADAIRKLDDGGICGRYDFYSGATALWYSLLGAHDKAVGSVIAAMAGAESAELFWDLESLLSPGIDPVRDDPRFKAALASRGLPTGPVNTAAP